MSTRLAMFMSLTHKQRAFVVACFSVVFVAPTVLMLDGVNRYSVTINGMLGTTERLMVETTPELIKTAALMSVVK